MRPKIKQILLLLISLISEACFAGEYNDCILENMKSVATPPAAYAIKQACREKSLPDAPAKCKDLQVEGLSNPYIKIIAEYCIEECMKASYWSKHFGDCKE